MKLVNKINADAIGLAPSSSFVIALYRIALAPACGGACGGLVSTPSPSY